MPLEGNELVLRVPHSLGAAEAQRRIAEGLDKAKADYGHYLQRLEWSWRENRMSFQAAALAHTLRGTLDVGSDYVELRAELPLVIRMLAKRFVPVVEGAGRKLLK